MIVATRVLSVELKENALPIPFHSSYANRVTSASIDGSFSRLPTGTPIFSIFSEGKAARALASSGGNLISEIAPLDVIPDRG
ncbi:MAG: hypothetical protein IH919_03795 [Deltaproteobacteria bacterium]|nr:hypothetical protein [Deltaproteobacteria bacterium]